jgi:ATP-dependent protease ClpP protease subunit
MIKLMIDDIINRFGISYASIREQLKQVASGEEIGIEINSPGGSVFEGVAIFNEIREFAKTHPVTVTITGLAASMASYIAIAARTVNPDAVVKANENSIFFIHNPWDIFAGDYRELKAKADYLERLAIMFASTYTAVSGKDNKEIRAAMDAETYYIGSEIKEAGFANSLEIINVDDPGIGKDAKAAIITDTQLKIITAAKKLRNIDNTESDLEKAVAMLETSIKGEVSPPPENSGGERPAEKSNHTDNGGQMTPEELKAKYSETYNAVFEAGKLAEFERVEAHLKLGEEAKAFATAAQFIREKKSVLTDTVQAEYLAQAMKNRHVTDRENENPENLNTGGEGEDDAKVLAAFDGGVKNEGGHKWQM